MTLYLNPTQISVDEIKRNFLLYLQRVQAGEAFVIVMAGQPLAEIKPIVPTGTTQRPIGLGMGDFVVPDDF